MEITSDQILVCIITFLPEPGPSVCDCHHSHHGQAVQDAEQHWGGHQQTPCSQHHGGHWGGVTKVTRRNALGYDKYYDELLIFQDGTRGFQEFGLRGETKTQSDKYLYIYLYHLFFRLKIYFLLYILHLFHILNSR